MWKSTGMITAYIRENMVQITKLFPDFEVIINVEDSFACALSIFPKYRVTLFRKGENML